MAKSSKSTDGGVLEQTLHSFAKVFNKVGLVGFITIIIAYFIIFFTNDTQKSEIIDTWVLYKSGCNYCRATLILLIFLLIGLALNCRLLNKIRKDEIVRISSVKDELQNKLSKLNLSKIK